MDQARSRVRDAANGFQAARTTWLLCTPDGRHKVARYREWLKKQDAKYLSAEEVGAALNELKEAAQIPEEAALKAPLTKRDVLNPEVMRKQLNAIKKRVGNVEEIFERAKRARLEPRAPEPDLEPIADNSAFHRAYFQAMNILEDALTELKKLDAHVDVESEIQKEMQICPPEVL